MYLCTVNLNGGVMICMLSSADWQQAWKLQPCGALNWFGMIEINAPINIVVCVFCYHYFNFIFNNNYFYHHHHYYYYYYYYYYCYCYYYYYYYCCCCSSSASSSIFLSIVIVMTYDFVLFHLDPPRWGTADAESKGLPGPRAIKCCLFLSL